MKTFAKIIRIFTMLKRNNIFVKCVFALWPLFHFPDSHADRTSEHEHAEANGSGGGGGGKRTRRHRHIAHTAT